MSSVIKRGPGRAQMNMTPLIDITFQVVLFFMLTTTVASRQIVEMFVPRLDEPNTRELGEDSRVVVNVAPIEAGERNRDQPLSHPGQAQFVRVGSSAERYRPGEDAEALRQALIREREAYERRNPDEAVQVVLRADAALYYNEIVPVIDAITAAGIEQIHMAAYLPDPGGQ